MRSQFLAFFVSFLLAGLSACSNPGGAPAMSGAPVEKIGTPDVSVFGSSQASGAQKLTYKVGPFALPAGQKASNMWESPGSINFQTEEPLWVISFENVVEDASGDELPPNLLHMAILSNASEKNPLCGDKEVSSPFIATTAITKSIVMPDDHGYPVLPTDQLDAKVMLQNPSNQDYENVYFKFTITAVPMKAAKNFKDVMPLLLDVDPCDHLPMIIAPKEFVKKEANFKVPEAGLLVKAYGLLQDHAVEISLNAKKQPLWDAKATLTAEHKIESLSNFEDPAGVPLAKGDDLGLEVAYDNSGEGWQDGATGAIMAYVTRLDNAEPAKKPAEKTVSATDAQSLMLDKPLDLD